MANCPPQTHVCSLLLQAHIEQWRFLSGQGSQDTFLENNPWSKMDPLVVNLLKARTFELTMKRRASVCTALHWALNSWPKTLSLTLMNFRSEIFHVSYDALPLFLMIWLTCTSMTHMMTNWWLKKWLCKSILALKHEQHRPLLQ